MKLLQGQIYPDPEQFPVVIYRSEPQPRATPHESIPMTDIIAGHQSRRPVRFAAKAVTGMAKRLGQLKYNLSPAMLQRDAAVALGSLAAAGLLTAGLSTIVAVEENAAAHRDGITADRLSGLAERQARAGDHEQASDTYGRASAVYELASGHNIAYRNGLVGAVTGLDAALVSGLGGGMLNARSRRRQLADGGRPNELELVASGMRTMMSAAGLLGYRPEQTVAFTIPQGELAASTAIMPPSPIE